MACDSAYGAYLKAYYPYEFYLTQLKLYTEKKDRDKIAALANEMYAYAGISLTAGSFGQDNRDWLVDKENKTISQSLSSIKFISKSAANTLYELRNLSEQITSFSNLLRYFQINTSIDTRQIETLIKLNYFSKYGNNKKLLTVFNEFFEGENKLTKTYVQKTVDKRMIEMNRIEEETENEVVDQKEQLSFEIENLGMCLTRFSNPAYNRAYYILSLDSTYGVKAQLYSIKRGTIGNIRMRKVQLEETPIETGSVIYVDKFAEKPRYIYKDNKKIPIEGETEIWIEQYHL